MMDMASKTLNVEAHMLQMIITIVVGGVIFVALPFLFRIKYKEPESDD